MTAQYAKFSSEDAFNLWHAQANAALGLPNPEIKTEQYTYLFEGEDGGLYAPVNENCPPEFLFGLDLFAIDLVHPQND